MRDLNILNGKVKIMDKMLLKKDKADGKIGVSNSLQDTLDKLANNGIDYDDFLLFAKKPHKTPSKVGYDHEVKEYSPLQKLVWNKLENYWFNKNERLNSVLELFIDTENAIEFGNWYVEEYAVLPK